MVSPMLPFGVRFRSLPPELAREFDVRVTPGIIYDVEYIQIARQSNGIQEVWLGITDDTGAATMFPARLCEIVDIREMG
ncbi:MAG: hypothetical protein HY689_08600 [Chloroflexi bacterium]|nr:hypothetical protein [Chloroflexota bacterium]